MHSIGPLAPFQPRTARMARLLAQPLAQTFYLDLVFRARPHKHLFSQWKRVGEASYGGILTHGTTVLVVAKLLPTVIQSLTMVNDQPQ